MPTAGASRNEDVGRKPACEERAVACGHVLEQRRYFRVQRRESHIQRYRRQVSL